MTKVMYNFAYGSNMCTARLRKRTPSARAIGTRPLRGYRLAWDKVSDGSRKCDAVQTGDRADVLWGVLFEIAATEEGDLDRAEGLGHGYRKAYIEMEKGGQSISASIYLATKKADDDRPFDWYKAYVLAGAKEHGLPSEYIKVIEAVPAKPDPDTVRSNANWAFLRKL